MPIPQSFTVVPLLALLLLSACSPLASLGAVGCTGSGGHGPDPAGFLFEEETAIFDFSLTLEPDALAALTADPRTDVHATFGWEGETWDVGVHLKGSSSFRTLDGKPSFKIDFRQWDPDGGFHGVHHLTLDNQIQDQSMMAVHATYWFYRSLHLPAPRHNYARLSVNGTPYGLYGMPETLDEQFLSHTFASDDGNLYKGGYGADLTPGVTHTFEVKEEGDAIAAYADLDALEADISAATNDEYYRLIDDNFDRDALLQTIAVEVVTGNSDGYVSWANNFDLYDDVDGAGWWLLSVGPDQAFTMNSPIYDGWDGVLAKRCLAAPDCANALRGEIADVADAMEQQDLLGFVTDTRAAIETACDADPKKELPCSCMQSVQDYIADRPDTVRAQLQ